MFGKILKFIFRRKVLTAVILLIAIGGGYYGLKSIFGNNEGTRYVFVKARKGTLAVSLSGSGQVSAVDSVDIKPKVSSDVVWVGVQNGQSVKAGTLIAQLDAKDAQKSVRDAEANLESAKLSLNKLKQPADKLALVQAENALAEAEESKQQAESDLEKAYDDGFNTTSNAFLDLPAIISGLKDILFSSDSSLGSGGQWNLDYYANAAKAFNDKAVNYRNDAFSNYQKARDKYDQNFTDYKTINRYSGATDITSLINETYETTKIMAEAVKSANNLIQFYKDKLIENNLKTVALADTHLLSLNTSTSETNSHLLDLLNIKNTIKDSQDAIVSAKRTINEKTESLTDLKNGADMLDIQSAELAVKQKENALLDAREKLADYFIRAPFDGIIAKIDAKKGDSVSSGEILASLITSQKIAEISLNEVDAAKIKTGQKAALTFDAAPNLNIEGQVVEIDTVGAVSQGVVTYNVKIAFQTQDETVKTAMSVSASIITEEKQNVLLAPNSAIKTQRNAQYVEIPDGTDENLAAAANSRGVIIKNPLRRQSVQTGLSNDEFTEITDGLKEGDLVAARTIQTNAAAVQTQNSQGSVRIPGLPTGGGGFRTR